MAWLGRGRYDPVNVGGSSGGMMGFDMMKFFYAIGVPLENGYGLSESGAVVSSVQSMARLESVGKVAPFAEVKITDEGEI